MIRKRKINWLFIVSYGLVPRAIELLLALLVIVGIYEVLDSIFHFSN